MKLFLASSLDKTMEVIASDLRASAKNTTVLFVANAADNVQAEAWWVNHDRVAFEENGFSIKECDLRTMTPETWQNALNEAGIVHFGGGSVVYLNTLLQKQNLATALVNAVKSGKVVYTGTSAGSMIAAPSIALMRYDDEEKQHINETTDLTSLNLVPFLILPHCNTTDFLESNLAVVAHLSEHKDPVIMLYDSQVLAAQDETFSLLQK